MEDHDIIQKGHPPIADKIVLVDFDGTLYPFGYMFDGPKPLPGAKEAVRLLKELGYTVIIFTSRLSPTWLDTVKSNAKDHIEYITHVCTRDGIPFDGITCEKIPAEFYIDDKAIRFKDNWEEIAVSLIGES